MSIDSELDKWKDKFIGAWLYLHHCSISGNKEAVAGAEQEVQKLKVEFKKLFPVSEADIRKDGIFKFLWSSEVSDENKDAVIPYFEKRIAKLEYREKLARLASSHNRSMANMVEVLIDKELSNSPPKVTNTRKDRNDG